MSKDWAQQAKWASENVARDRAELARTAIEDEKSYYRLADAANAVAEAEGARYVYAELADAAEYEDDTDPVEQRLQRTWRYLNRTNLDDTWSGRTGDIRRAYFDGVRQALNDTESAIFGRN